MGSSKVYGGEGTPKYSFVVPCLNARSTLSACLDAIVRQTSSGASFELIVVDNGSTDASPQLVPPAALLLHNPVRSRARTRNLGAQAARGEYLCFVDADVVLGPRWLQGVEEEVRRHPEVDGLATRTRPLAAAVDGIWERYRYIVETVRAGVPVRQDGFTFVNTRACVYRRDLFQRLGGFDERLRWYEDVDLSRRAGLIAANVFEAGHLHSVTTDTDATAAWQLRRAFFAGRHTPAYYQKWGEGDALAAAGRVARSAKNLLQYFWRTSTAPVAAAATLCFLTHLSGVVASYACPVRSGHE